MGKCFKKDKLFDFNNNNNNIFLIRKVIYVYYYIKFGKYESIEYE